MRRLLVALFVVMCLSASGCVMPGDWWPFGAPGENTYNSNTEAEAANYSRSR